MTLSEVKWVKKLNSDIESDCHVIFVRKGEEPKNITITHVNPTDRSDTVDELTYNYSVFEFKNNLETMVAISGGIGIALESMKQEIEQERFGIEK